MDGQGIISINPANVITIWVIAAVGMAVIGFATKVIQAKRAQANS